MNRIDVSDYSPTAGEMVEVRTSDGDVGSLRRDLDNIGVRVEEVAELTIID